MTPLPLTVQTLYADLVQDVHSGRGEAGSVYKQTVRGTDYLYLRRTVGEARIDRFLGRADDPDVQARATMARAEAARAAARRKTVSLLRGQNVPAPTVALGRVLDALADAGLFREAVLVGTAAYQCYSPVMGVALPSASLMTQDADLATASLVLAADEPEDTLEAILRRADKTFAPVPGLDLRKPPSRFKSATGFLVDILTPQLRRSDTNPMPLKRLGAGAIPLQHLGWLIETPVQAVALHGPGVPVRIPAPARYAAHKLIVAQKRSDIGKRQKDMLQSRALIEALQATDPWALTDAVEHARSRGRDGWRRPLDRSLKELGIDLGLGPEVKF